MYSLKRNLLRIKSNAALYCMKTNLSSSIETSSIKLLDLTNYKNNIGMIGLGSMGSKMVMKLLEDGYSMTVYDVNSTASNNCVDMNAKYYKRISKVDTIYDLVNKCDVIISILPNDDIVHSVSTELLDANESLNSSSNKLLHISCSTISPVTSRSLENLYENRNATYIASPVFARPDGLSSRSATWMISGKSQAAKEMTSTILSSIGNKMPTVL